MKPGCPDSSLPDSSLLRVVPFEELRDPRDFFELMEACFGEVAAPEHPELLRRHDERRRGEFGFGVYRGRTLASFIGVAELKVRTRSGKVEWDTPMGHALYTKDGNGYGGLKMSTFARVESNKLVPAQ